MPLAFTTTVVAAYSPYIGVGPIRILGFLPGYASERGIISGQQFLILNAVRYKLNVPTAAYVIVAAGLLGLVAVWLMRHQESTDHGYVRSCLIITSFLMVLLTPHFSWYYAWLIPFLCFIPSVPVLYLTLSSFLLYLTWFYWTESEILKIKLGMFLPFVCLICLVSLFRNRRRFHLSRSEIAAV